jgi:hypothetical protein
LDALAFRLRTRFRFGLTTVSAMAVLPTAIGEAGFDTDATAGCGLLTGFGFDSANASVAKYRSFT